jgi:hypothetical protein
VALELFELFHGAVFTVLMRNERPLSLRMFEKNAADGWAAYRVNDEFGLYIKYRTKPHAGKRLTSWNFAFGEGELEHLRGMREKMNLYLALVCGRRRLEPSKRNMHICLLDEQDMNRCIDMSSIEPQWIRVLHAPGKFLRAYGSTNKTDPLRIPHNRIETWEVPGS